MVTLSKNVMVSSVRGLIDTSRFDEATQLIDFFPRCLAILVNDRSSSSDCAWRSN
jgi:hypothetical protein